MNKRNQYVVPRGNAWAVKGAGAHRATAVLDTQHAAIELGHQVARKQGTELFIHDRHGQIRARDSYGHDPFPPKG